ncbi:MAG: carboxypeptidase regulatory-like domain-containing protein, partial [Cyclobacteriaceae bacterium]|nr:carboxypeptidase regulatory-like domain-containing protein [Cyclobacteriaceae bacterium]
MIKKNLTIAFLIFFSLISVYAQKGNLSGVVVDETSNDNIPFASVALFDDGDDIPAVGSITDDSGNFALKNIAPGNYKLVVSFIGYNSKTIENVTLTHESAKVNLGKVVLIPANINIKEVEVTAMQNTVSTKIDRKVYSTNDFETAKGGTAVDVLNKLPSVSVNPDGEVSVRGTTDFMVYLNGKPTQLEPSVLLAQLSADAIENIEVITVPTARYDAQGKGGIINVVTKRTGVEGLSLFANALVGGAPWGHLEDPLSGYKMNDTRYGGGINYVYVKNKISFYGGYYYNKKNINGDRIGDARILQENGSYYHMVASGERPEWFENYAANYGLDFRLSKKSVLSAAYYYGRRTEGRSAFYVYNNFYGDIDK